tara:strand:- start:21283 stop:21507 length:225 start_codon:yes stop_codon:yes gene_type:complete
MGTNKNELNFEIKETEKEKKFFDENNVRNKNKLISEIKMGLGVEIKKNPSKAKIIKKTRSEKIMIWLRNIFTKF